MVAEGVQRVTGWVAVNGSRLLIGLASVRLRTKESRAVVSNNRKLARPATVDRQATLKPHVDS